MLRLLWPALMTAAVLLAQAVSIQYDTLPAEDINRRLSAFKNSNADRERQLYQLFSEAGCTGEHLSEQLVRHSREPNVICALPGQGDPEIIVGAHFDFVDRGQGVVDNWSGCSLLPSLYQSLRSMGRRHKFVFVGFTDEEKGLVGSEFFVHQIKKEDLRNISAMVNMDSVGTGPTEFELDRADKKLASALATIADSQHLPWQVVNVHQVGKSDSDSFEDRHVPTILIHSITNDTWPILHSPRDQMAAIRLTDYYDTYRLVAAYLAYLDVTLDTPAFEK
jgi:putative aminopeptidase FrvX